MDMDKKDNVKQFPKVIEDSDLKLTQEEIDFIKKRDEDELNGYLNKFKTIPQPDSSLVEEEDEDEEETITLDFTEEGVKAYEKVGEGVAVRGEDGNISLVQDEELADKIKQILEKEEEPKLKVKYENMFSELLVSKAIASLIRKLNDMEDALTEQLTKKRMGLISGMLEKEIEDSIYSKKMSLRTAIAGGKVHYDKIPQWAEGYVDEYVQDAVSGLVELTERD
jgi:hypothetical protein